MIKTHRVACLFSFYLISSIWNFRENHRPRSHQYWYQHSIRGFRVSEITVLVLLENNSHSCEVIFLNTEILISSIRQYKSIGSLTLSLRVVSSSLATNRVIATTGISVPVWPMANPRLAVVSRHSLDPITTTPIITYQLELHVVNTIPQRAADW